MTQPLSTISIVRIWHNFEISDLENESWNASSLIEVSRNWDGSAADPDLHFSAETLWSDDSMYFRFVTGRSSSLVINPRPQTKTKTIGLWERDVCEVFIAPNGAEPRKYFEFEVAPTGEWVDLALDSTSGERVTDWEYRSGMEVAAESKDRRIVMVMKIPWEAFGDKPKPGDVWLGNIFRCVGREPDRGYLAWQPTLTKQPNFHVPERFGKFVFAA
jgi:hypothetical protein